MKRLYFLLVTGLLLASCQKEDPKPNNPGQSDGSKAYVLNEGLWGANDSDISLLNIEDGTIQNNYFATVNGRGLGNLGQDVIIYGSKMYITVNSSNTIEIVDAATCRSIKQISIPQAGPRYMACHEGKVYITCYDKTVRRLDTLSMEIDGSCNLSGLKPEGIAVSGDNLYVCNSWDNANNGSYEYDNTLSVVNINLFSETRKITVPINPSRIVALADGRLVVNSLGNYADQPSVLSIIDPSTDQIQTINIPVSGFDIYNNAAYTYSYDWSTFQHSMIKVDLNTLTQTPILQDKIALFGSIYGIAINPVNGDIYICDAQNYQSNGDVYCFSSNGQQRFKQETTVGPNKVVFVR